jgi:hypothetical protein
MFFTSIFVLSTDDARHQAPKAFLQFLEGKYSFQPDPSTDLNVNCTDLLTEAEAIKIKQGYLAHSQQSKVVETGWTFGSSAAAPAASASPAEPARRRGSVPQVHDAPGNLLLALQCARQRLAVSECRFCYPDSIRRRRARSFKAERTQRLDD